MERETGSFIEGVVPLSAAVICVCGNTDAKNRYVNCNEDGVPFSIWEAWETGEFIRPEGFAAPPETPYGFCVLCPECGRFYSEKEIEVLDSAVVAGKLDADTKEFASLVASWNRHNKDFFQNNVEGKPKKVREQVPRPGSRKLKKNPIRK